ncbi:MAG: arsenate reductase ArsC [candidate division WOR-3 bacterium]
MRKPKVLFLCYHNSARSQMAEGLLRELGGDKFDVYSAGIEPTKVHPLAIKVMQEIGIDISNQKSKSAVDFLSEHFGYIITVCDDAKEKCPVFPGIAMRLHWPFEDPALASGSEEKKLLVFRKVRDQIREKIINWLNELKKEEL